ncbi:MAG: Fe-S protein assembly co-chaperone HscB [Halieaceae bacterium]|nr:Fe-S protein assembly co-chaperone HscB [Halieaceae bacterium]
MDFSQSYFELFELPQRFELDTDVLARRYRELQMHLHPDKHAAAGPQEQRLAVQYSAFVNGAFHTLKQPLPRALYLLNLAGWDKERVAAQPVAGDFLLQQMELREALERIHGLVNPEAGLEHLQDELAAGWSEHSGELSAAMADEDWNEAAAAVVKMQYLDKLRSEVTALENSLLDS